LKKKILFIVNPISGGFNKTFIPSLIDLHLDHQIFDAQIVFSEYIGHAKKLARNAVLSDYQIIVAVGGDGTINEVASEIESTGKIMSIIPCGSGNGLARTLKISLNNAKAIAKLNQLKTTKIDVGVLNEKKKFFNMAGMGFDAHISALFAGQKKRGFSGYIKSTFKEIANYKPEEYLITVDGAEYKRGAFMLSIANSSQYGNNAHVSPSALVNDGLLDLCIIKPFSLSVFPSLAYHMFNKSANKSKYVEIIKAKQIKIQRASDGPVHLDGEPFVLGEQLIIDIKHLALELVI
jgi:diacylglycerol kinase (ATP)